MKNPKRWCRFKQRELCSDFSDNSERGCPDCGMESCYQGEKVVMKSVYYLTEKCLERLKNTAFEFDALYLEDEEGAVFDLDSSDFDTKKEASK